jgi:cyclopropane fatty-acyl-phospholipid synthase-like methyltransferase
VNDPRTRIVGDGYDAMADDFAEWRGRITGDPRGWWLDQLTSRLDDGARVLELGCGRGDDARPLATRFDVTRVDISSEQIARARERVPNATFVPADFTSPDFEPGTFDAVAAVYVLNHVPRDLLPSLLSRVRTWLGPGGYLLTAFGTSDTEGWVGEWLGTEMFFSSFPPETNSRLLAEAGFELVLDELETMQEPEGAVEFQWVLARR